MATVPLKRRRKTKRMQELGYKALTTFLKEATYHAMKRHAADVDLTHSAYLRLLVEEDLIKKGYLPPPPPASRKP